MKRPRTIAGRVEAQALAWFLKLRIDDVSYEDIAAWEAWLNANPRHAAAYDKAAEAWNLASQVPMGPAGEAELIYDSYDGAVSARQWRRPRWSTPAWIATGAIAASLFIATAVTVVPLLREPDPSPTQVATARGQREAVLLSDGSKMVLGGMAAVEVRYTKRERQLLLERGAAAFEVAHGKPQRFVVKTRLADVTAVGTAFDINVKSRALILAVSDGAVKVDLHPLTGRGTFGAQPLRVSAGQILTVGPDGFRVQAGALLRGGWMEGWLGYRNEPLWSVIEDVNRYADKPIRLQDTSLGELTYTGTIELSNTNAWITALPNIFPVEVRRTPEAIMIEKKSLLQLPKPRRSTS